MPKNDTRQITTREASEILGKSIRATIRLVEAGKLTPAQKLPGIRGAYLFNAGDVQRLKAELESEAVA